jgi:hypothetical protein
MGLRWKSWAVPVLLMFLAAAIAAGCPGPRRDREHMPDRDRGGPSYEY